MRTNAITKTAGMDGLGIVGEYVGAIHTQILKRPLVIERERLNFARKPDSP